MKILVFGETGQVAREIARIVPTATFLGRDKADLMDPSACAARIAETDARAVINAAAYTAVDKAESDSDTAFAVNGAAPAAMARACAGRRLPFVHVSTDYVFDGAGETPFRPEDPTGPLGVYGASKLAGENGIRAAGGTYAILRTSWVFSAHGANFVKTMLRLGATRDLLTVVADQIGGPTSAASIARAVVTMADRLASDPAASGTYHFSGAPDVSWADFAREIFAGTDKSVRIKDIPTTAFPTPAARPANSRLDCTSTMATFGLRRPDWRRDLVPVLKDVGNP